MLKYYKLFDLLNRRGLKKTDLLNIISAPTLAKLGKGKNVQTDALDKICLYLNCQPGDIMECILSEQSYDEDTNVLIYQDDVDFRDVHEKEDIVDEEPGLDYDDLE